MRFSFSDMNRHHVSEFHKHQRHPRIWKISTLLSENISQKNGNEFVWGFLWKFSTTLTQLWLLRFLRASSQDHVLFHELQLWPNRVWNIAFFFRPLLLFHHNASKAHQSLSSLMAVAFKNTSPLVLVLPQFVNVILQKLCWTSTSLSD